LFFLAILFFVFQNQLLAASNATIGATVKISVCGNNIVEADEQCDGSDLNNHSCSDLGYDGGTLSCNASCTFNTSACTSGGGGGGGGGSIVQSVTSVTFSGRAYPSSKITVLKDGQKAITTIAGPDAKFYVSLTGLSAGNYLFSVYGEDNKDRHSSPFTFSVDITKGATTNISGIFIAPTVDVDKSEVKRGDSIGIFGQSVPNSEVTIAINSEEEFFVKTDADENGIYLYNFDTSPLAMEQHFTKSKASSNGEITSFGKTIGFLVGTKNVVKTKTGQCGKADLNCDGRVNLVDFSIAAYWNKRTISTEFEVKEGERLNGDGKVDLVDFSIMAFYWTG